MSFGKMMLAGMLSMVSAVAVAAPKTNLLSQWSEGSDAAAVAKLGNMFTAAGGQWQATSIAGHTANTLAKLRADVVAGNAPPAVQLNRLLKSRWKGRNILCGSLDVRLSGQKSGVFTTAESRLSSLPASAGPTHPAVSSPGRRIRL